MLIWWPFFKAHENKMVKEEMEMEAND